MIHCLSYNNSFLGKTDLDNFSSLSRIYRHQSIHSHPLSHCFICSCVYLTYPVTNHPLIHSYKCHTAAHWCTQLCVHQHFIYPQVSSDDTGLPNQAFKWSTLTHLLPSQLPIHLSIYLPISTHLITQPYLPGFVHPSTHSANWSASQLFIPPSKHISNHVLSIISATHPVIHFPIQPPNPHIPSVQKHIQAGGYSSEVEFLPSMCKALSSILSTENKPHISVTTNFMCRFGWVRVPRYLVQPQSRGCYESFCFRKY